MSTENIIQKLKERRAISRVQHLLAQPGTVGEAFWDGYVDGLAVAILIVECEE